MRTRIKFKKNVALVDSIMLSTIYQTENQYFESYIGEICIVNLLGKLTSHDGTKKIS